jgi:plastocyanin
MKRLLPAATAVLALAALGSATAADRSVAITRTGFVPADVTIAANDSVTWKNTDTVAHRVVFDKAPCSLTIQAAATGSCTFRAGGKFNYRDPSQGGGFRGTVTVTGPRTSVSLSAARATTTFAVPLALSGFVSNQQANETVTVESQECGKTSFTRVAAVPTGAGGSWTLLVKPSLNTIYHARWRTTTSAATTIKVQPQIRLSRVRSRFTARVTAAQAFTGKLLVFQRYRAAVKRWATLKRVTLGASSTPAAGTVVTQVRFRARFRRGWRLRVILPQPQAGSCYLAAASNTLRVR